CLQGYNIPWTF
nr:immunoglobulin light chain junction region [Macaca mulatta]MOW43161.1 immunoglobulin light chain junction region [Macaca mulatta]MOW44601.1 immunoglobulin light chain junction region [Macaca mulatta]